MMYEKLVMRLRSEYTLPYSAIKDMRDAADVIDKLGKELNAVNDAHNEGYDVGYWAGRRDYEPKWIPVTERLPEYGKHVLVYAGFFQPYIEAAYYCEDKKWLFTYDDAEVLGVSHWMPLPNPPKEVE